MRACRFFNSFLEHLRHNTQDFKYKLPKNSRLFVKVRLFDTFEDHFSIIDIRAGWRRNLSSKSFTGLLSIA